MVFIAPEILFILFMLPKIDFCKVSGTHYSCGTHYNSRYIAPFVIVKRIFIKIFFINTIGLIRTLGDWHKVYQNVCSYFNPWMETAEETVDLLFIFLFVPFGDIFPNWSYLPILINTVKQDNASASIHHRAYFSLYSYLLFL